MEDKMRFETKIQMNFSETKKLNNQFSLVDMLLCYHGENRNGTSMSKEVIENALPSLYGVPIVGEYIYLDDGSQDFGSHGGKIIIDDKHGITFEETTKPYGFITEDAVQNASWVTITEPNGHTQHEYLQLKGAIVWTERYNELFSLLEKDYGQSMEIVIEKDHYDENNICVIDEFTFSAACILGSYPDGEQVIPCFESAYIGRHYKLDSFKQEFSAMLDEYKEYLKSNKKDIKTNNKTNDVGNKIDLTKGDINMEWSKFVDVLSTEKIKDTDNCKYHLLDVSDTKVMVMNLEEFKPYGFDYAVINSDENSDSDTEQVVIDFDSMVEMSFSAREKITDENFTEIDLMSEIKKEVEVCSKTIEEEFNNKYEELRGHYETLNASYQSTCEQLNEYTEKERLAQKEKHAKEIDDLFDKYSEKLSRCAEFLVYKAKLDPDKVTVDEVNEKLTLMVGRYMMDTRTSKNFDYQPVIVGVDNSGVKQKEYKKKYGNLLDKYMD